MAREKNPCRCSQRPWPGSPFYVYVIELTPEALPYNRRNELPLPQCVYVGESAHTPDCRFAQHKAEHGANLHAEKYGVQLLPELYESWNPLPNKVASQDAEARLAKQLEAEGYFVIYGPRWC